MADFVSMRGLFACWADYIIDAIRTENISFKFNSNKLKCKQKMEYLYCDRTELARGGVFFSFAFENKILKYKMIVSKSGIALVVWKVESGKKCEA